ncbi:MAG: ABC transporter substrate-binding protein [Hyphomicrobiaceae bacterium]
MSRRLASFGIAAAVLALGAASGPVAAQTLTVGVRGGPESMDPHYSALGTHADAVKHIFDTLVHPDEKQQLTPGLAESWKPIDDTTWEFKLRKGVKFHDGSAFTADDVKFSIERIPVVTGPTTMTIYVRRVKSVEVKDPLTVIVKTNGPAATLPYDFVRLFIVSSKAAKDCNTKETAPPCFNSGKAAIGTGPYKLVSWQPKSDLVLERNDGYWRGKPYWQRVVRKEISNDAARLAALKSGQVDIVNYVSAADYKALARDKAIKVIKGDSVYVMNLQLDQREPTPKVYDNSGKPLAKNPLRDPKVREALDLAIDRRAMVDVVLEGLGNPANQLMSPGMFGYNKSIPFAKPDPAKAKKLLAEAGYPSGFSMDLYCTSDRLPGDGAICQGLGQMFSRIGIKTKVNAISKTVYFPAQARLEYSVFMNGWGTLTGEASYTLGSMAHSKADALKLGAFNRIQYKNEAADKLIQEGARTLDDAKRRKLYEEAMAKIMADRAYISVVVLQTVWAARANKVDYTPRYDEETLAYFIRPAK